MYENLFTFKKGLSWVLVFWGLIKLLQRYFPDDLLNLLDFSTKKDYAKNREKQLLDSLSVL